MEQQVSAEVVKDRFDRLLAEVQKIATEQNKRWEGTVQEVLVENVNEQDASLVTGRLSNNSVVHFAADASTIGTIRKVKLLQSKGFYYIGEAIN